MSANKKGSTSSNSKENTELITRENVKDTPFVIIGTPEGYFGSMGPYRITEVRSKTEVKKELEAITWNRIVQVMMLLLETHKSDKMKS